MASLRACLTVIAAYATIVALAACAAFAAPVFVGSFRKFQVDALYVIAATHICVAVIALVSLWALRRVSTVPLCYPRLVLAAMPIMVIGSCDRLALLTYPPMRADPNAAPFDPHPTRGWTLRPGGRSDYLHLQINHRGMRGALIPYEKPRGTRRVVILGDSVAFGLGVPYAECFDQVTSKILAGSGESHFQFVNLSVPGYTAWQHLDVLQHEGVRFEPDLVVYAFCLNDVVDWFWRDAPHRDPPAFRWTWLEHIGLARLVRGLWHDARVRQFNATFPRDKYALGSVLNDIDTPGVEEVWSKLLSDTRALVAFARAQGFPIAFALFPQGAQMRAGVVELARPQRRLVTLAKELGVPCLDLLDSFRRSCRENPNDACDLFFDDWHLSKRGHEVAADAFAEFLRQLVLRRDQPEAAVHRPLRRDPVRGDCPFPGSSTPAMCK